MLGPRETLPVFKSLWDILKLQQLPCQFRKVRLRFGGCCAKEFAPAIDEIDPHLGHPLVHGGFNANSILGEM